MLAAAVEDTTLAFEQATNILVQLFTAGTETTTSLIARSIETLATNLELQAELRNQPERIPIFVEEVLRHAGPFQFHYRWTPAVTTFGDTPIPAGSVVLLMWAAADRPTKNELPSAPPFDLDNDAAPHLAFGRGLHFCIGAHLARLEARLATEQLLARTINIRLDPHHPASMRPLLSIKRMTSLSILVSPTLVRRTHAKVPMPDVRVSMAPAVRPARKRRYVLRRTPRSVWRTAGRRHTSSAARSVASRRVAGVRVELVGRPSQRGRASLRRGESTSRPN